VSLSLNKKAIPYFFVACYPEVIVSIFLGEMMTNCLLFFSS
jgi:hypothetical protein